MVNKKYFAFILFFSFYFINLHAQNLNTSNQTVINESSDNTFDESSIILSDDNSFSQNNTEKEIKSPSTVGLLLRMIIVLIIVIGIIYGVFWFIKKKTNIVKTDDDFLRRVAYINIAAGKTVEVITLIDKAYLIGVTEDNITLLGEINDKELINAMNVNADKNQNVKKPLNFADVLDIFTAKGKKTENIFTETENNINTIFNNQENTNGENENV